MSGPGTKTKDKPNLIQSKLSFTRNYSTSASGTGSNTLPGVDAGCGKGLKRKMDIENDEKPEKRTNKKDVPQDRSQEPCASSSHENSSTEKDIDDKAEASVSDESARAEKTKQNDFLDSEDNSSNVNDSQNSMTDYVSNLEDDWPEGKPDGWSPENPWKGKPKDELKTAPKCLPPELRLFHGENHEILIKFPVQDQIVPGPDPQKFSDEKWDNFHVHMPCSKQNVYPVDDGTTAVKLKERWSLIEEALKGLIGHPTGTYELEEAILSYNQRYKNKWRFTVLHHYFRTHIPKEDREHFFEGVLPQMVELALKLPEICTKPIPLLKKGKQKKVTLSQQQIACLLANAFFCTFPRRNSRARQAEFSTFPDINFNNLFQGNPVNRKMEKLNCIIHYFKRVLFNMPCGIVTFSRQMLINTLNWQRNQSSLTDLHVSSSGTIEDDGTGMLQVDFANKYIGGGVLGHGCVQEEIRFMICPEMIVTRLFTEMLTDTECLIMTGCEQFSKYSGYADSFMWTEDFKDKTERDSVGRLCCEVVAIDAMVFRSDFYKQFKSSCVLRELNKAFCGFKNTDLKEVNRAAVCTGNWGCGAFGGDKELKSLIQLIAAAAAKRDVCYFTFGDEKLTKDLHAVHASLKEEGLTLGEILKLIEDYNKEVLYMGSSRKPRLSLFKYIDEKLGFASSQHSRASRSNSGDFDSDSNEAQTW